MIITNGSTPTLVFLLVSATDPAIGVAGATSITVEVSRNGGAFTPTVASATGIGGGWYRVVLTATETNTDGPLIIRASGKDGEGADTFEWRDIHQVQTPVPATLELDAETLDRIADHVLRRDFALAASSSDGDVKQFRSLLGSVAKSVNRVELVNRTLNIYEADDTNILGTQTVAVNNDPPAITGLDTD